MRRLVTILTIIIATVMGSKAAAEEPDFAFPKTVSKEASADLKAANKQGDAHAALNALIRLYIADALIDPETAPESLKVIQENTDKYADTPWAGVFYALQAKIYSSIYESDKWKYNRRNIPLTPQPADLSEWSGEQFKAKIAELCAQSYSNPTGQKEIQLKDCADIVDASQLALTYFPTMLDFVCIRAVEQLKKIGSDPKDAIDCALSHSAPGSAAHIEWLSQSCTLSDEKEQAYLKAFKENQDCEYAAPLLLAYANANTSDDAFDYDDVFEYTSYISDDVDDASIKKKKFLISIIDQFLDKFSSCPYANNLLNLRQSILRPTVAVSFPSLCAAGEPLQLKLGNTNAEAFQLLVYCLPESVACNYRMLKEYFNSGKLSPIKILNFKSEEKAPFQTELDTLITLPAPGYYAIVPQINGKDCSTNSTPDVTRCIPVYPFTLNNCNRTYAIVSNPATGLPIAGATVSLKTNNDVLRAGLTNLNGMINLSNDLDDSSRSIIIGYEDNEYGFSDVIANANTRNYSNESNSAQILTDRALYHPGEKVNVLAIVKHCSTDSLNNSSYSVAKNLGIKVILYDANRQSIDTISGTTDAYGRVNCQFTLPTEGLTGDFSITVKSVDKDSRIGSTSITVSDYKLPEYELIVESVMRDKPAKGCVTINGCARTYAGTPVTGAEIEAMISAVSFWRWMHGDEVGSASATTDSEGKFTLELTPEELGEERGKFFIAQLTSTSQSGTIASASVPFTTGKRYVLSIDLPNMNINSATPFTLPVDVTDTEDKNANIALRYRIVFGLDTLSEGDVTSEPIDLSKIQAGRYKLIVEPVNPELADSAEKWITIYNPKVDIVPGNDPIFVPIDTFTLPYGETAASIDLLYGTTAPQTAVYYTLSCNSQLRVADVTIDKQGYHHLKLDVPADFPGGQVKLFTVKDCKLYTVSISLTRPSEKPLQIKSESFRDRLVPMSEEQWQISILDGDGKPVEAALALDMYNHALDALTPHSFRISAPYRSARSLLSFDSPYKYTRSNKTEGKVNLLNTSTLDSPVFNFYGTYPLSGMEILRPIAVGSTLKTGMYMSRNEVTADAVVYEESAVASEEESEVPAMEEAEESSSFDYRDAEVALAIWTPMLTTDTDGNVAYSFTVPNANATWRLCATAWTENLEIGNLVRDLIANKPVMVMPNTPRFLRAGDKVTITASVINNTDSDTNISTTFELFNPSTGETLSSLTSQAEVAANASIVAKMEMQAPIDANAIGIRVKSTNGQYTDGEQTAIPILPSEAELIETYPFYLNPGDTNYSTTLPDEKNARLTLTLCENPAWTIVSALPGMRRGDIKTANAAAAAIFSASVSQGIVKDNPLIGQVIQQWLDNPADSALISTLEKNEDLKQALLNCTPWVQAAQSDSERMANLALIFDPSETNAAIESAIKTLDKLVREDGGWAWGEWCKHSSRWVTLNVLAMMAELKQYGWMPDCSELRLMIECALAYLDNDMEEDTEDIIYAIIRHQFGKEISGNGQKVIDNTIAGISKNWKKYTPASKAMAAEALWFNNRQKDARKLMSSISEFGVWSKDQGLRFPSVNALYDYAIILGAYARIEPNSKEVDGLRQQLIVRKQGTDWGSSVVTNEVVESILSSGSTWTVADTHAEVKVGNTVIQADGPIAHATGQMRADLSQHAGQELSIETTGVGPAYGAVFAQFEKSITDVEAASCDDLSIDKKLYVRNGTGWIYPMGPLKVGDRVKVQLTIHCKRNLDYVTIIDNRPAAFEPVVQLPGWMYSEGVGFYRENRDSFTSLYVDYMRPGTYMLTYEMKVTLAGTFLSGVATIQSQYAPELSAHSCGTQVKSEE